MGKPLRQWRTAAFLAVILLVALAQSATAATRDSSAMKRILVLGDSLSAGFGLTSKQAYPALLAEKLRDVIGALRVRIEKYPGSCAQ